MASQQSSSSQQTSSSKAFSGIENEEALATLMTLIGQLSSGGTDTMKAQAADKKAGIDQTLATLGDYTKKKAFTDALDLMTSSMNKSLEASKPAIQRAVEGAGTSASSMQALLSQRAANDASTQAGALGAEQAKAYGAITAQLLSTLNTSTSQMDPVVQALIQALDLTKISRQESQSQSTSSSQGSSTDGGGGGGSGSSGAGRGGSVGGGGGGVRGGNLFDGYGDSYNQASSGNQGQWLSTSGDNFYDWNTGTHSDGWSDSNGTYTWEVNPSTNTQTNLGMQDSYDWGSINTSGGSSGGSEWYNPYISQNNSDSYEAPSYDWNTINTGSTEEWYNPYA